MASYTFWSLFVISAVFLIDLSNGAKLTGELVVSYKQNLTIDCSDLNGDVEFYTKADAKNENDTDHLLQHGGKFHIDGKKLIITDLRSENIRVEYYCKSTLDLKSFTNKVTPYIYKPDKASQTATVGGETVFRCSLLYGNEQDDSKVNWKWSKNGTELKDGDGDGRISVNSTTSVLDGHQTVQTALTIRKVTDEDKGDFNCEAINNYGSHTESVRLRVKDVYAALWPFLVIVGEVLILCIVILVYEKKCAKKPNAEEDNEQAQNLMGNKDGHASDVKKRNAKA